MSTCSSPAGRSCYSDGLVKVGTILRIARDRFSGGPRQTYWNARALAAELIAGTSAARRGFLRVAAASHIRFLAGHVAPIAGQTLARAHAAARWLLRAQQASSDGGVSYGYFPCSGPEWGWKPSYPETTGYVMTSLLAYGSRFPDQSTADAVGRMAHWEAAIQMPSGAVQGGQVCAPERQTPAAFNTGMVLDGWCSAYLTLRQERLLDAARRAADWLVNDLDEHGYFRTNGEFVTPGEIKTYTCLCGWALYRFGRIADERLYQDSAVRTVEAALRKQEANGWFAHNCLARSDAPLTHTIGYTLQGIIEVGALAEREDFIGAARKCVDQIMRRISPNGYLPGRFYRDWEPAAFSCCLTGSAQVAIAGFRLYELTNETAYRKFGDTLVDYLKGVQELDATDPEVNGALAGSFPIFGGYMRGGYPNWATKYFLDALLLQDRLSTPTYPVTSAPHPGALRCPNLRPGSN